MRRGTVDHADSLGATARYGDGDTQWLTTGRGVSHSEMFWGERTPRVTRTDERGHTTTVTVIAGALDGVAPLAPPPESWASNDAADLAIWHLDLAPEATFTLPTADGPVHAADAGRFARHPDGRVDTP